MFHTACKTAQVFISHHGRSCFTMDDATSVGLSTQPHVHAEFMIEISDWKTAGPRKAMEVLDVCFVRLLGHATLMCAF